MAFFLHSRQNYQELLPILNQIIMADKTDSIFNQTSLIVDDNNQRLHLNLQLANLSSISANLKFHRLSSWLTEFWHSLNPYKLENFTDRERLLWEIFKLLKDSKTKFHPQLAQEEKDDFSMFCSAEYISNYLLQVINYRNIELDDRKNNNNYLDLLNNHLAPLGFISQLDILNYIKANHTNIKVGPEFKKVIIWGFDGLYPLWLDVIKLLKNKIDFHFFLLSPSNQYWIDKEISNHYSGLKLANELAINQKNLLTQLLSAELIEDFGEFIIPDSSSHQDNLLSTLKLSLNNLTGANDLPLDIKKDVSANTKSGYNPNNNPSKNLQIISCQDPYQEVNCVKQTLEELFEQDKTLQASDVLILVSNLNTYISPLKHFFADPFDYSPKFLANLLLKNDSLTQDFLSLCQFLISDIAANDLSAILKSDSLRNKFNLSSTDLSQIRSVFNKLKFFWGTKAKGVNPVKNNESNSSPNQIAHLPANNLDDIVLTIAVSFWAGPFKTPNDILKRDDLSTIDLSFDNFGGIFEKFLKFYQLIVKWRSHPTESILEDHNLHQWADILYKISQDFFISSKKNNDEISNLLQPLLSASKYYTKDISFALVFSLLTKQQARLNQAGFQENFRHQGIKFGALQSYFAFPAKIVFLLGANQNWLSDESTGKYIREIFHKSTRHDPCALADYQSKILGILTHSEQYLQISYLGSEQEKMNHMLPANFVVLLKNWAKHNFDLDIEQEYITKYMTKDVNIKKYPLINKSPHTSLAGKVSNFSHTKKYFQATKSLTINDLKRFWQNPTKYCALNVLKTKLPAFYDKTDKNYFATSNYTKDSLVKTITVALLEDGSTQASDMYLQFKNILPEGELGTQDFNALFDKAFKMMDRIRITQNTLYRKNIPIASFDLKGKENTYHLHGDINILSNGDNKNFFQAQSRLNWVELISNYIDFLCLKTTPNNEYSISIGGWGKKDLLVFEYQSNPSHKAKELLGEMIDIYNYAQNRIFMLDTQSAKDFIYKKYGITIKKPSLTDYSAMATTHFKKIFANPKAISYGSDKHLENDWLYNTYQTFAKNKDYYKDDIAMTNAVLEKIQLAKCE
ncbi:MAG: exodeoxyribonuclease V subunit gamma [SAR324 cluster bacterium]|nr:exodeoxyribonuclease V subunit gamma [SAR324 cluster bacterium]